MSKEKEYIENFTSIIPSLSACFIVYSILEIFLYYQFFNFNILPFLEVAELLPLALFEFIIALIVIIIFCLVYIVLQRILPYKLFAIALVLIMTILFIIIIDHLSTNNYALFIDQDLYFIVGFFSTIIIFYIKSLFNKLENITINSSNLFIVGCLFSLLLLNSAYRAYNKFYDVRYNEHYTGTYIIYEKDTIRSISNYYYIGKCKNNFMFYDVKTRSVDLYSVASVSKARISSK